MGGETYFSRPTQPGYEANVHGHVTGHVSVHVTGHVTDHVSGHVISHFSILSCSVKCKCGKEKSK